MNHLLVGLGNPPKKYAHTRHNAGRMLAAFLRRRPVERLDVVETDCFMNQSGEWIYKNYKDYKSYENLIIAHDDLDLPLGSFKIHFGRGPRLHRGILSIEQALGTKDFWRIRIGIDNRKSQLKSAKISLNQIADKPEKSESDSADLSIIRSSADASRSKPTFSVSGEDYVLKPFSRDEKKILFQTFEAIRKCIYSTPGFGA